MECPGPRSASCSESGKKGRMMTLDLAVDVVQFVVLLVLAAANGVIAFSVFRIQKDRNTPKLAVYMELVEDDDREYLGLYVQNVGLVPALNVSVVVDIEEWRDGHPVRSRFHERYEAFQDHHVILKSQEHRLYELPAAEGWALIVSALTSCSNGPSDSAYFVLGDDRSAIREVAFGKGGKKAIKRLKSRETSRMQNSRELRFVMGLNSLKDYDDLFRKKAVKGCGESSPTESVT